MPEPRLILHVENDTDDVFVTQRAFMKAGVEAQINAVGNGEQAVAYLLGEGKYANRGDYPLPSIIILDWNMPLMSGGEFLAWRQNQPAMRRIPVVVLTSSSNEKDVVAAYELGSNGYVIKPSNLSGLQALARAFADFWLKWNHAEPFLSLG